MLFRSSWSLSNNEIDQKKKKIKKFYAFHLWKSVGINKNTVLHWLERFEEAKFSFSSLFCKKAFIDSAFCCENWWKTGTKWGCLKIWKHCLMIDWSCLIDNTSRWFCKPENPVLILHWPITKVCGIDKLHACVYSLIEETHLSNKNVTEWENKHMALVKNIAKVCIPAREIYVFV